MLLGGIATTLAGTPAVISALTGLGHLFVSNTPVISVLRRVVEFALGATFRRPNRRVIFQNPDDLSLFWLTGQLLPIRQSSLKGWAYIPDVFVPVPPPEGPPLVVLAARMLRDKGIDDFVAVRCSSARTR